MLRLLRVRKFALIDELEIEFEGGFNLLSGETGAGKSLIVDALALIAGAKASSETIRSGESRAIVEAVFQPSDALDLAGIGIDCEDELVLRREISADNRNRVFLNSQPSTVTALRKIAPYLVDIHGQHEQQTLLDTSKQLAMIDLAAEAGSLRERVHTLYDAIRSLEDERALLEQDESELLQRADFLRFQREEIERVQPKKGETDLLGEKVRILAHSGKLLEAASGGYEALYEADASILSQFASVERSIRDAGAEDTRLADIAEQATTARTLVEDLAYALRDYLNHLEVDPAALELLQARLAELERLHRKYGPDLLAHLETVIQELDNIGLRDSKRLEITGQLESLKSQYRQVAGELSQRRRTSSTKLAKSVTSEIRSLAMPSAEFRIEWTTLSPGRATGIDEPQLLLSPNPGEPAGRLAEIASGGELSRAMLALRTVMVSDDTDRTLVFDEIDAGIGGEAAETVGRKLKLLSNTYQVLCVTHLAQIARFADQHARIEKLVVDGRTVTRVEALGGDGQVEELARMMSGPKVSDAARRHVRELLKRQ